MRAVSLEPDWPASGEVLIPIVTPRAGSSIAISGSGRGSSGSAIVSPIVISGMPARAMISPGPASSAGHAREPLVHVQLGQPHVLDRAVAPDPRHLLALADRSVVHAAEREPADVRVGVEVRDARLKRVRLVVGRRRDALHEQVEQRTQVGALDALLGRGPARLRVRVDDRELDLLLVRVEVEEQLVDLVDHLADARVGPVDLVHHEHHRQSGLERLAQHEAGLGERALGGVHEEHHAVHHRQAALHLAAEVGVARGVDEVELHVAVAHRRVLGEDRDAALALLVHRVHDQVGEPLCLVGGEDAGLAQHRVDQRGLAVVDVRDDRDVADV